MAAKTQSKPARKTAPAAAPRAARKPRRRPEIPVEFWEAMADFAAGRWVDMETAMTQPYPGDK